MDDVYSERAGGRHAAFTMLELIVTIVVAGVVLLALFAGLHEAIRHMGMQRDFRRAVALSEDLMNEVRSRRFDGGGAGLIGKRADCIGVDDYHRWFESPPQTMEGGDMTGFEGFARSVLVEHISADNFNFDGPAVTNDTGLKRITVVVSNLHLVISNASVVSRYDD